MMKFLTGLFLCISMTLFSGASFAQVAPVAGIPLSGTIATTNTFQVIQATNGGRKGCTVQNNGANNQWVYFDSSTTCANATKGKAISLGLGQPISCSVPPYYVLSGTVCITGTGADTFFANFQ